VRWPLPSGCRSKDIGCIPFLLKIDPSNRMPAKTRDWRRQHESADRSERVSTKIEFMDSALLARSAGLREKDADQSE
jgi:hypothetical protein